MRESLYIFLLFLILMLVSCARNTQNVVQKGKVMVAPEVRLENTMGIKDVVLPEISEVKWDFYKEEGKNELSCKYRMRVKFKEEAKFMAKVHFLDLYNFPVATEKLKLIGLKDEDRIYEQTLYINPKLSSRITKVRIDLTPIK